MDSKSQKYLYDLYQDRVENAEVLEKPSMRGTKDSVVEKYSDQAHFIYELLQNADDANATYAKFVLESDRLIFKHNGTRFFSVSNPLTEDEDSRNGKLGDINAITSIANSNKTEASIGKFGVGFKAVFQYTSTPHIYDPIYKFKIERFIVPVQIFEDFEGREESETVFVFPFDHAKKRPSECYDDISNKLKSLSYPLLFLSNIDYIEFEISNNIGLYSKSTKKTRNFDDCTAEYLCLTQNNGDDIYTEHLWLFSRENENNYKYSVGFFTDDSLKLKPVNLPAFCFFPTKETTNLNFIIHAPFLLTDSREGIRAGQIHNEQMIELLAHLAADSLLYLRDIGLQNGIQIINDDIISIIPYDKNRFSDIEDKSRISFMPFYFSIESLLKTKSIIPSTEGYTNAENAYWAEVSFLTSLFSNVQLGEICSNDKAKWAFPTLSRNDIQQGNKPLFNYLDSLLRTNINEDIILKGRSSEYHYNRALGKRQSLEAIRGINASFIEHQCLDWLFEFYKWIFESKNRTELIKKKPIFLDQNKNAVAAYDETDHLILFLPVSGVDGYSYVNNELLNNEYAKELIKTIEIKEPSLKDQIYNVIIPKFNKELHEITIEEKTEYIKTIYKYYRNCQNDDVENYIETIRDVPFVLCHNYDKSTYDFKKGSDVYFPSNDLVEYLGTDGNVSFVAYDEIKFILDATNNEMLMSLFHDIGVNFAPVLLRSEFENANDRDDVPKPQSSRPRIWKETSLYGYEKVLENIVTTNNANASALLWRVLLKVKECYCDSRKSTFNRLFMGECVYFYYREYKETYETPIIRRLRESKWILNKRNEFARPCDLIVSELSEIYDLSLIESKDLITFLQIPYERKAIEDYSNLTEEQVKKIKLADEITKLGLDESDLPALKKLAEKKKTVFSSGVNNPDTDEETIDESTDENDLSESQVKVINDIAKMSRKQNSASRNTVKLEELAESIEDFSDSDELIPSEVDFSKRIEKAKEKSAREVEELAIQEELQKVAVESDKYSYGWFKSLLELELRKDYSNRLDNREISISFAKVERESGKSRTLILKHPSKYIPQFMEDLSDIPLTLVFENTSKTVVIEVANVMSYTLRVKLKSESGISDIDFTKVIEAKIDAKSPEFLLKELRNKFLEFGFDDSFNMQQNLPENIEFVFGPPGTGKTTHLAKNVIIPIMNSYSNAKVLVLAPTNKAADVITRRIMEVLNDNPEHFDWLIRFGGTGDEYIEQSSVYKDKTFDIREVNKNVTVTTIARFPYDFFMPENTRIYLNGLNWNYIIIDEASMIPLANILYPIYKKTPRKFIVAGDPFQIEPITSINLWKNENIYTMVGLNSFANPKTIPHDYKVDLLTTQYRSLPSVGSIFSEFAYNGILKHYREENSRTSLNIENDLSIKPLNIIKFPVSKYESIYKPKRLNKGSSYQVYSALFIYEFVSYLSKLISNANRDGIINIGIIAPYRAEAELIDRLISSLNDCESVNIQVGTIHGFQGDECDIIFAVFNTPPSITKSREMFLNKLNIINVAISRAKDYLFVVMPDDSTDNINNLHLVKKIETLIKRSGNYAEFQAKDLELQMFGSDSYLEQNSFATGHQSVNVYGMPEMQYEIRSEDTAVDIQIHNPD